MSLDEKMIEVECNGTDLTDGFLKEDIKQFIKELKLAFPMAREKEIIDGLAGEGLI